MAGNVATLWGNDAQAGQTDHLLGDVLCLIAAVLYAVYTTLLMVLTNSATSMNLVFGALGVAILAFATPVVLLLRWKAFWEMSPEIFGLLIFNGIFDNVLSQYAWAKAVQWTSPTTATVGLSLTIPLSILADVVRRKALTVWSFIAALLVVLGFVLVPLASAPNVESEAKPRRGESAGSLRRSTGTETAAVSGGVSASTSFPPQGVHGIPDGGVDVRVHDALIRGSNAHRVEPRT